RRHRAFRVVVRRVSRGARRGEAGFTLLEILIVIVIIAMAATIVAPAVEGGLRAREGRSAVRAIAGTMRSLQADAVRTGNIQRIDIDPVGNVLQLQNGAQILMGDAARIHGVRGGDLLAGGIVSVSFYPNGSNSGVDLLIGERGAAASEGFVVHVDPLIGVVSVADARS